MYHYIAAQSSFMTVWVTENVLAKWLRHDNARPRTARANQERIQELQWELLEHSPCSPELAPSDIHLFGPLEDHLGGNSFANDQVETKVRKWLRQQTSMLLVSTHC
jgi:hypothetical protein